MTAQRKHDDRPEDQRTDELPLMFGEEEEGEAHDTVDLDEGAEHDEEGCPEVLLALDTVIGEYDDGGNGDVELLHLDAIQHLVGTEPIDEHLLVGGEDVMPDGDIEKQGQRYQPQEHTQPRGRYGKGGNDHRKRGAVVVQVEVFCGVMDIERQLMDDVPELVFEDQEIVLAPMSETRHTRHGDDHPHPKQCAWIGQDLLQPCFHFLQFCVQRYNKYVIMDYELRNILYLCTDEWRKQDIGSYQYL